MHLTQATQALQQRYCDDAKGNAYLRLAATDESRCSGKNPRLTLMLASIEHDQM